jgi:hypothetical protein
VRTGGRRPRDWGRATQNGGGRGLGQGGRAGERASGRADAQGSAEKVDQVYVSTSYFLVVEKEGGAQAKAAAGKLATTGGRLV